MRRSLPILLSLLFIGLVTACVDGPNYPNVPAIEYLGVNKLEVYQSLDILPDDTLRISFSFTDGDGDLSTEDVVDVFLFDSRFPEIMLPYKIPTIPEDGVGNGIRGEITVNIPNVNGNLCCIEGQVPCSPTGILQSDTFSYEIQIRDRAGNFSNRIRTETLTILCRQ